MSQHLDFSLLTRSQVKSEDELQGNRVRDLGKTGFSIIDEMIASMDIDNGDHIFRVADVGYSDIGGSLEVWHKIFSKVNEKAENRPIEIVYAGFPYERYDTLFEELKGQAGYPTYFQELENIHVFISSSTVYQSVVAPQSLDLVYSGASIHHLSRTPCKISDHLHMVGAEGAQRSMYQAQGHRDWESFLLLRAAEMKSGARLFMFNFCIDDEGNCFGGGRGYALWDLFADLWDGLARDGVITRDEFLDTNFAQCFLTVEEFSEPFLNQESQVYQAGLRLDTIVPQHVPCPIEKDYLENHKNVTRFCDEYIETIRVWAEYTFLKGLSNYRRESEKRMIIDLLFKRFRDVMESDPEQHNLDCLIAVFVCQKI